MEIKIESCVGVCAEKTEKQQLVNCEASFHKIKQSESPQQIDKTDIQKLMLWRRLNGTVWPLQSAVRLEIFRYVGYSNYKLVVGPKRWPIKRLRSSQNTRIVRIKTIPRGT